MPPDPNTVDGDDGSKVRLSRLLAGLEAMGIEANDNQVTLLLAYLRMLERWNKAYNLTAVRDGLQMVNLHLLDSLSLHHHLTESNNIIDVGTGPGLPGIPLAEGGPS